MPKKKVLIQSNFSKSKTGFGRNAKAILQHLYRTGKYELVEYGKAPLKWGDPACDTVPWKCYGALPPNEVLQNYANDQATLNSIGYGSFYIDDIIKKEKPDVYIGIEDFWAFPDYWDRKWWNKIPCVIWTTLDSLPIHSAAIKNANKIDHFWVWADFAREAMHKDGFTHVKTLNAAIDMEDFTPLSSEERIKMRQLMGVDGDCKLFGFVFRNQLRKLVGQLLEGLKLFQDGGGKGKVWLHTNEFGWEIDRFIKEFGLDNNDVLFTQICKNCKRVSIAPWFGKKDCKDCGAQKKVVKPDIDIGCTEKELNILYNLCDAYIHPMTSGGIEMPIIEAMAAGLPVATVPYSCGREFTDGGHAYPLEYTEYREWLSNFIKANPTPESIAEFMRIIDAGNSEYQNNVEKTRDWVVNKFSTEKIGKYLEDFIDSLPEPEEKYDFDFSPKLRNPDYPMPDIADDSEFITNLYENILCREAEPKGLEDWLVALHEGRTREDIYNFFIDKAKKLNAEAKQVELGELFEDNDKKRLMYIMPGTLGDCFISLPILKRLNETYPSDEWDIYVSTDPRFKHMFEHLPYIKRVIDYHPQMDDYRVMEGCKDHEGYVDVCLHPYFLTQRAQSYIHNGQDLRHEFV